MYRLPPRNVDRFIESLSGHERQYATTYDQLVTAGQQPDLPELVLADHLDEHNAAHIALMLEALYAGASTDDLLPFYTWERADQTTQVWDNWRKAYPYTLVIARASDDLPPRSDGFSNLDDALAEQHRLDERGIESRLNPPNYRS